MKYGLYILRDRQPVLEPDARVWSDWCEEYERNRKVARTYLGDGALCVHTSFLGMDHNFSETGPPILFETMIEDMRTGAWWSDQWRCATWDKAEEQHKDACLFVVCDEAPEPLCKTCDGYAARTQEGRDAGL